MRPARFARCRSFSHLALISGLRLAALSGTGALGACSSPDAPPPPGSSSNNPPSPGSPGGPLAPINPNEIISVPSEGSHLEGSGSLPINLGSETLCDGLDENDNGIIDDVDVGGDGLCDCIRLGFFGQVTSDAGAGTTAFESWLVERSGQVPLKRLPATSPLTREWLADLQVLVVGGMQARAAQVGAGPAFTQEEIAAFDDWIRNQGGGVITLSGYSNLANDARPTHELLATTGMGYNYTSVPAEGVIGEGAPPVWLSGIVAPDHPTVENVAEIGVYYGYPVTGDGTTILRASGYDLAMAKTVGSGRVFVFADEWITQDLTWSGSVQGQNDACQQPCNEQTNICRISREQCAQCATQPCSDPSDTDITTCAKGCQPSCDNETQRCEMYTQQCQTCAGAGAAREQATARLWLNTIRWLTPDNECKVEIPLFINVR